MSARKVRKVRHREDHGAAPTFSDLASTKGDTQSLLGMWKECGWNTELWGAVDNRSAMKKFLRLSEARDK